MIGCLVLATAVATATPPPTASPSPTVTPVPAVSEVYGRKTPWQVRQQSGFEAEAPPTPTEPANSLAAIAARIKINRSALAGMSGPPPTPDPKRTPAPDDVYQCKLVAYDRGDGVEGYAVLEDRRGREIAVPGTYTITYYRATMYERRFSTVREGTVGAAGFSTQTVGVGGFAHDRLLISLPRVSYADMAGAWGFGDRIIVVFSYFPTGQDVVSDSATIYPN